MNLQKKMLISNSLGCKLSREIIKSIAQSNVQLNLRYNKNQNQTVDSLLINLLENLQDACTAECYQKDLTSYLKTSKQDDFLTALHSIILNPQYIELRCHALYSFSHALKIIDDLNLITDSNFFTKEVINFYSQLLFDCDISTELFSLSIINSILFDNFNDSKTLLLENELPSFLIESDSDLISPLFVAFSKSATHDQMECLYENGFINVFFKKLLNLVSSKSIETSSNAMESIVLLLQNKDCMQIDDLSFLQSELIHNIYSEDERCIEMALKLMVMLDLPPIDHFGMIYTFVGCRWTVISLEAIKLIRHFSSSFDQEDQNESKALLLNMISEQPFKIEYECLTTLLSSFFLSLLNIEEKKHVLKSLIMYLSDEELSEQSLKGILTLFGEEQADNMVLVEIIFQEFRLIENLLWSENENTAKYANQILSMIEQFEE